MSDRRRKSVACFLLLLFFGTHGEEDTCCSLLTYTLRDLLCLKSVANYFVIDIRAIIRQAKKSTTFSRGRKKEERKERK